MTDCLTPSSTAQLVDAVRSTPRVQVVGAGTKPRLSQATGKFARLSTVGLRGIVEYEPEEFTVTALAGTPVIELADALDGRGQYLPFDPMFARAGSTLGGAVGAGTSGPGRFRFGGVRDFILGVRFVDGLGRLLRMGGKVVKNAAGFDVPKFLVGSLGRFGVMAEITLKVFPKPASALTLEVPVDSAEATERILTCAAASRWQLDALDVTPPGNSVFMRLAGPAPALASLANEILARWPGRTVSGADADQLWTSLREAHWAHPMGVLIKAAMAPSHVAGLLTFVRSLEDARAHVSSGGNVAFISLPAPGQVTNLQELLRARNLPAVTLRGDAPLWLGAAARPQITAAVKNAFDPQGRFPALDD
jgi:glycolate oxidase FAD binding subunit